MGNCSAVGVQNIAKYYTFPLAPSPRVVDIFAREKGLDLTQIEVILDLGAADNRNRENLARNPGGQVPYFEMLDGTVIAETVAMCEYLEEAVPNPPLIGRTQKERAETRMWLQRMQEHYVWPAFAAFRHWTASPDCDMPNFKDFFSKPLPRGHAALLPDTYKDHQAWALARLQWLDDQKAKLPSDFICGDRLTLVDIQVFATLNGFDGMSQPFLKTHGDRLKWLPAWFARMKARASVKDAEAHAMGK